MSRISTQLLSVTLALGLSHSALVGAQSANANGYQAVAASFSALTSDPVILLHPGIPVDPAYDPLSTPYQQELSALFDQMMSPTLLHTIASPSLGDFFIDILTHATWATVPLIHAQRDTLSKVRSLLYTNSSDVPTVGYQNYLTFKAAYAKALADVESVPPDHITPELRRRLDSATNDLNLRGHKAIYENAETQYNSLIAQSSYNWRNNDLKAATLAVNSSSGIRSYGTTTVDPFDDFEHQPWTHIALDGARLRSSALVPGLAPDMLTPTNTWWQFTMSPAAMPDGCSLNLDDDDVQIEYDAVVLPLSRTWYDGNLWTARSWRLDQITSPISDGTLVGNKGTAPLVAVSVILVRNFVATGGAIKKCLPAIRVALRSKQSISFGPFKIAATTPAPSLLYLPPITSTSSIRVTEPQILAFGIMILPQTPNPNNDFAWPSH